METSLQACLRAHGTISREDGKVVIRMQGNMPWLLENPHLHVTCENPGADPDERIYRKEFQRKPIAFGDEIEGFRVRHLGGRNVVVLGANGYSELKQTQCAAYGVDYGAYETAVYAVLEQVIADMRDSYPGITVKIVHGASNMPNNKGVQTGVDTQLIKVARAKGMDQLGFSCPEYMFYVADDDIPVCVGQNKQEYADLFNSSLHILLACNGRAHSFQMDYEAVFRHSKHVIPMNVLRAISRTGGPPAIDEATGKIEDAVALLESRLHVIGQSFGLIPNVRDPWQHLVRAAIEATRPICRGLLEPSVGLLIRKEW